MKPAPNHNEEAGMEKATRQKRIFFAAEATTWNTCICEGLAGNSYRYIPWSKLTKAEWRRGKELVKLLITPDGSGCPKPFFPKTEEMAKALEEFVAAVERRHGAEIWRG
jgi:hypothetical protein